MPRHWQVKADLPKVTVLVCRDTPVAYQAEEGGYTEGWEGESQLNGRWESVLPLSYLPFDQLHRMGLGPALDVQARARHIDNRLGTLVDQGCHIQA